MVPFFFTLKSNTVCCPHLLHVIKGSSNLSHLPCEAKDLNRVAVYMVRTPPFLVKVPASCSTNGNNGGEIGDEWVGNLVQLRNKGFEKISLPGKD